MARPRRLVVQFPNGANIDFDGRLIGVDMTAIPNADARAPLRAVVQQQCDLLCWHDMSTGTDLPLWDD